MGALGDSVAQKELMIIFLNDQNLKMLLVGFVPEHTLTMKVYGNKCSKSTRNFQAVASDFPFFDIHWTLDEKDNWSKLL